jgi:plastocyanin
MAIANLTREVALVDSDFLGLPVMHHISDAGYWYTYHPSDLDSNNVLTGNSIQVYEWDTVLSIGSASQLSTNANRVELDGTITFIDDSHAPGVLRYHGGCIQDIGPGLNDITNQTENDAFMFAHIGTFGDDNTGATTPSGGSLEDDAFYWDRLYQANAGGNWEFYQYHKHLPSNYSKYDDGRIVFASDGYIRPADKQFGYLINILAKQGQSAYSVPLARIHTPSVGGAHNSHNDVTLPNTAGINYMPGGILKGGSNRFHAFYLSDAGANGWNVFSRTYTSTSGSFTNEVNYGTFDIADPDFNPYPGGNENAEGTQSSYALRISAGHAFGSKIYMPVIMKAEARPYNYEVTDIVGGGVVYAITGNDRQGAHAERNQPTIYIKVGDTLTIENSQYLAHPMYIRDTTSINPTPTSHNVAGASGGGTGSSTLTFTPQTAETVYYICSLHNNMYGQIVITERDGTFDQKIWQLTDANTISPGTLNQIDMPFQFHGLDHKPDCYITSVGSNIYVAASSGLQGGVQMFSAPNQIDSVGDLTLEGNIVTNDSDQFLRLHGFKYNAATTKFFTLLSGVDGAAGNYSGKGLYSFDLAGGAFDGYDHMSYDTTTGTFTTRSPLQGGYLRYTHSDGVIEYNTGTEPEGIANGTSIFQWKTASPTFYNLKEINTGNSEEYYFQGIYLEDGRKALVGRLEGHPQTTGAENTGDLLLTIVDNENNSVSYTWGGTGDNFLTGIIEDKINNKLVLSGYSKGELAPKGDQWVHGWGRNIHQSNDSADMYLYDVQRDSISGNFYTVGNDTINGRAILQAWDKNYNYKENYYYSVGPDSTNINSIDIRNGYAYTSGWTKNQTGKRSGFINKINLATHTVEFTKGLFQGTNVHKITDHCIVTRQGQEYVVGFIENNSFTGDSDTLTSGLIFLMDPNGNVTVSKSTEAIANSGTYDTSLHIKRIKPGKEDTGDFFFVGSETRGNYRAPMWGYGNVFTSDLIHWNTNLVNEDATAAAISDNTLTNYNNEENVFNDIDVLKYYSDSQKYDIIVVGQIEDLNLTPGDSNGTNGYGFALAEKWQIYTETTGSGAAVHNTTKYWSKTYQSQYGNVNRFLSVVVEDSDKRDWWKNEDQFFHNGQVRFIVGGEGWDLDSNAAHPDYTSDILMRRDTFFAAINDSDGSVEWANSLGHMGNDDINKSMVWDAHGRNFVAVGSSTSHSVGEDGILFRLWKDGFGTGVYHTEASTSNAYYYDSIYLSPTVYSGPTYDSNTFPNTSLSTLQNTASLGSSLLDNTNGTVHVEYNGSYGANGLFTGFLGIVDQGDLQSFKNTDQYIAEAQAGKIVHRVPDDFFEIHQVSTVGDATADDGNVFAYDVIKSRDQEYYYLGGQVSGNIARTNDGQSGVYDYTLFQWDIASEQFRFWQNGTAQDEEIYAITELTGTALLVTNPEAAGQGRQDGTVEWTPSTAGTYYYQCGLHTAMQGQLIVTDVHASPQTFNITVTNNASLAFRFSGSDRNGTINSTADNPTITIDTGDTVRFNIQAPGHPFYIQTAAGTGGSKNGHIAFCGRTTGQLGTDIGSPDSDTPLFGGYDLFLGIFDPNAWVAEYYNQGSGFNDKAMNVHDLHPKIPNTLALVYTSFGSVNGSPTFGSEDIGVITFNYDTDSWSQGFQVGSETSEEIDQNGKPSTLLSDGRIAVVCNTAGTFADNSITYGLKDMGLAIFDFDSDGFGNYAGWSKYQIGSGSADFSYSIDNNGTSFLITGFSEATWDKAVSGVFVEFDPERNILAKSA